MEGSGDQFDVIVVGAGIMGSCTAYQAAKRGHRVLLLEQFDFLHHRGSSHGESRTIRATYPEAYYPPMVLESSRLWEEAQAEIGYRVLTRTPHFDIGPADSKSLRSLIANSVDTQLLKQSEVNHKFSSSFRLPDGWIGLASEGGVIKPTKALAMFHALALKRGAILKDHKEVIDIKKDDENGGGIIVATADGDQFRGRKCVVTAGTWTRKLVKTVSGLELPIQPLHTAMCYWKIKEGFEAALRPEAGFPTFSSHSDPSIYGTPSMEFPGLIKIAMHGGHACDPDRRNWLAGSGTGLESLSESVGEWIGKVMPERVENGAPVMVQGCMYSMTPDEDFVVDFVGGEFGRDLVVAGGFSGHGFKMGPVIGRILTEMVVDGEAAVAGGEMDWFKMGRFEGGGKGNAKEYEDQVFSHVKLLSEPY